MNFNSSYEPQVKASTISGYERNEEVYWRVDVNELFGIDLTYKGITTALNQALQAAKIVTPIETGLLRRSLSLKKINDTTVECYFDRKKIVGRIRKGITVTDYYPKYLSEHPKTFNWLSICIKHFYDELFKQMKILKHKEKVDDERIIRFAMFEIFYDDLNASYKEMKQAAKIQQDEQLEKQRMLQEAIKEKKRLQRIKNEQL